MRSMMKKALLLLMAALMLPALSACAGEARQDREPEMYIEPALLNEDEEKMAQLAAAFLGRHMEN